jgi:hypothetical protein
MVHSFFNAHDLIMIILLLIFMIRNSILVEKFALEAKFLLLNKHEVGCWNNTNEYSRPSS